MIYKPKGEADMTSEVIVVDENGIPKVVESKQYDVEHIPPVVKKCVLALAKLQEKVDNAVARSDSAKTKANTAAGVKLAWYKVGDKAKAIEALQSAVSSQSDAMLDQSEAMMAMLEYQKAIAHAMQFLLNIGVSSMANNRAVYDAVKAEIQNCSEEELSELAKQEFKNTLAQLQSQQDILRKQEETHEKAKRNRIDIKKINALDEQQEKELARQRGKDEEHDQRLDEQAAMIKSLQAEIASLKGENAADVVSRTGPGVGMLPSNSSGTVMRKWCRSSDEKIIAGVCAGLAHRFEINPWAIRIACVVVTIFCLIPPVIYLILMFMLKPHPTKAQ